MRFLPVHVLPMIFNMRFRRFLNVTWPVIQKFGDWVFGMLRKGNVWPWHWLGWLGKRSAGRLCDHVRPWAVRLHPRKTHGIPAIPRFFLTGIHWIQGAKLNTGALCLKGSWVFRNRNQHQRPRVSWSNNGLMDFSTVARKMRKASGSVSVGMLRWKIRWHVIGRICFMPNLGATIGGGMPF